MCCETSAGWHGCLRAGLSSCCLVLVLLLLPGLLLLLIPPPPPAPLPLALLASLVVLLLLGIAPACSPVRCIPALTALLLILLLAAQLAIITALTVGWRDGPVLSGLLLSAALPWDGAGPGRAWTALQTGLACCGASGPEDWTGVAAPAVLELGVGAGLNPSPAPVSLPASCCPATAPVCLAGSPALHSRGCAGPLWDAMQGRAAQLAALCCGLLLLQLTAILLACCLCCSNRVRTRSYLHL